jgi:16S rRNA (cytidine1402-2'-O)-methyltransferase
MLNKSLKVAQPGILFIVATPIGDWKDITLRALEILKSVDAIVCEEARVGSTLLKKLGIEPKELILLNEHNEKEKSPELITRFWRGQNLALISDAGTPLFADPGAEIVSMAVNSGIRVVPIPGPSSLTAFLSILDQKLERFLFAGFLTRDPQKRKIALTELKSHRMSILVMDTPYRLKTLLEDIRIVFGKGQRITLGCDLTLPNELILRGNVAAIQQKIGARKAEFMLLIHQ